MTPQHAPRNTPRKTPRKTPRPRSLVNCARILLPEPPGHPGAPRSLKFYKTSAGLETSSNFLRGGCAIRERARKKSTFSHFLCRGRGSRPRYLSRIMRKTLRTLFFTKENGGPRTPLFIEDPIWGVHFIRAGAHETHFFCGKSDFTPLFIGRKSAGLLQTWHGGQVYKLKENPGPKPFPGKTLFQLGTTMLDTPPWAAWTRENTWSQLGTTMLDIPPCVA